jgi:hypothetical protein
MEVSMFSKRDLLAIIILLVVLGCSHTRDYIRLYPKHNKSDPVFDKYKTMFVSHSLGKVKKEDVEDINIGFVDNESSSIATCYHMIYFTEISVNRRYWEAMKNSEYKRANLLLHELGHCVLLRPHTVIHRDSWHPSHIIERFLGFVGFVKEYPNLVDGCPYSIMHPTMSVYDNTIDFCFNKHEEHYLMELYNDLNGKYFGDLSKNCPNYKIINKNTSGKISSKDWTTIFRAEKTCIDRYKSCLKSITLKNRDYKVKCR